MKIKMVQCINKNAIFRRQEEVKNQELSSPGISQDKKVKTQEL